MRVRVVDASALGALAFGEPEAGEIAEALGDWPLVAPALLWFEVASICLKKIETYGFQSREILAAFELAGDLAIDILDVDHPTVVELARRIGLTTYDASYLWLARELDGVLVTLDQHLRVAGR